MKEAVISVLKVEPHNPPEIVQLENNLAALQKAVSIGADYTGLIEIVALEEKVCILCNEEGKLIGLEPNRRFRGDVLCGVFYVVGENSEGELVSLPEMTIQRYATLFKEPEEILPEEVKRALVSEFFAY